MRVLFFGAGAIGTYIGRSLALAGHQVSFIERPEAAEPLRANGLRLQLEAGPRTVNTFQLYTSTPEALDASAYDFAVYALKSFDTAGAIQALKAVTPTPPPILCLQNGVDNERALTEAFGAERVIPGTVTTAVGKPGPGQIIVERKRGLGVAMTHPLSPAIVAALNEAGLNARPYANAGSMKWSKLLTNLIGNATSAILDLPVADLFANRLTFAIERLVLQECLAVMKGLHLPVVDLPRTPARALALAIRVLPAGVARPLLLRSVGAGRGAKMPSFHIDLHGGRGQTEVQWLNGAVARYGAEAGVAAPVNQCLTDILTQISAGQRPLQELRRQPEKLLQLINADRAVII